MNLLQRFTDYINGKQLFSKEDKLLLAVSGGLDSVVLTQLCKHAGYAFSIAHCNFGLRGTESNRDEAFVNALANQLNVEFLVKHFDTKTDAVNNKVSIQVAARQLRYQWFHEIIRDRINKHKMNTHALVNQAAKTHSSLKYILTAHHLDDNIETVLMNLFKGTGISGLHGILPKTNNVIRPLLFATRQEILDYANEQQLTWVEDSSNTETKYTRNYFRHELIPAIEKIFPTVKENMAHSIQHFNEAEILYNQSVSLQKNKLIVFGGDEVMIPVLKLQKVVPLNSITFEIIKDYGFSSNQVPEVIKLLSSDSGKYIISSSHRILRNRAWLIISPLSTQKESILIIKEGTEYQEFPDGRLKFECYLTNDIDIKADTTIAFIDAKVIKYPLLLRKWKAGDYFYPLGMTKKKKLARFFIDLKLSQLDKENIWVLESNKRIVWIIGYRIDERFKITASTKELFKIKYTRDQ